MTLSAPAVSWWFLAATLVGLWFMWQALSPVPQPSRRSIPSFFAGWLANELAVHHVVWQLVATALFVWGGALSGWPGWVGLAIGVLQWCIAWRLVRAAVRTPGVVEQALVDALGPDHRDELPDTPAGWDRPRWAPVVLPVLIRHRDVERRRNVVYGRAGAQDLRLDVFAPRGSSVTDAHRRPAIVYVHGGAWTLGFRQHQGLPLLVEMARRGWVGIQPSYRLSPVATFPDHLVDVKRAIAWVRDHADELGVDPGMVAVAGGSAGGHLAALAALTADRAELQPGFDDADTAVQACVPIYGVYDPPNELGHQLPGLRGFLARYVLKADPDEAPERWRTASPAAQLHAGAPPFLVVHGDRDTLTSPQEGAAFAANLREVSRAPAGLVQLPGAQHAFDMFPSIRTAHLVLGVARFLAVVHRRTVGDGAAVDVHAGPGEWESP